MLSDYWLPLLVGFLLGSAITAIGMYALGFRRVHRGGRTVVVPELDRRPLAVRWSEFRDRLAGTQLSPRAFTAILALMVLAMFGSLVQTTLFIHDQRRCNSEFQRTIAERSAANADSEVARKENDQAVLDLVRGLLVLPPAPGSPESSRALLERFDSTVTDNNERQEANERRRAANPYPQC